MKKITVFFEVLFLSLSVFAQNSQDVLLRFKYFKGDRYRILSTVNEDVYFNGTKDHSAVIVNRVTAEVTDVDEEGNGILDCVFMTSEESSGSRYGRTFEYGEEYKSIFKRSALGKYEIDNSYFMPVVRDVPLLSEQKVSAGDKWKGRGHEAHDLRQGFGLKYPFKVPFDADYVYLGLDEESGLHKISVKYTMTMKSPKPNSLEYNDFPVYTQGYSDELIWWDNEKGTIDHYSENFSIQIKTALGNIYEFKGNAWAEVTDFERTSTNENLISVQNAIEELELENVNVVAGDKGLTISIEDIKFLPDSAELMESEKIKLQHIGEILKAWPNNDLLITGHTALAGSEKMRQILSEERAGAVADYLINIGVKDIYHIFTKGMGASVPIAPNTSESGKARNRRVEITILEK